MDPALVPEESFLSFLLTAALIMGAAALLVCFAGGFGVYLGVLKHPHIKPKLKHRKTDFARLTEPATAPPPPGWKDQWRTCRAKSTRKVFTRKYDQAIQDKEYDDRLVCVRFGHDWDKTCMAQDEILFKISEKISKFCVIFVVDITEVPDFNAMYELYDPCTLMFFFRNRHIGLDVGTGNNNKVQILNWKQTRQKLKRTRLSRRRASKTSSFLLIVLYTLEMICHQPKKSLRTAAVYFPAGGRF